MGILLALGFSSGLPLLLTGSTLLARLTSRGTPIELLGLLSILGLPYSIKWLWAPFLDRTLPGFRGRRRSWMLVSQAALALLLVVMAFLDPGNNLQTTAAVGLLIAVASATQDIAIDAYRTEVLPPEDYGAGAAVAILGYRIGMIASGAGALLLAQWLDWVTIYLLMAGLMTVGAMAAVVAPEPEVEAPTCAGQGKCWEVRLLVEPLRELLSRPHSLEVALFIVLYKAGDVAASALNVPFLLQSGYSYAQVGVVLKGAGIAAVIAGGLVGGALMPRVGVYRALVGFGVLQGLGCVAYGLLAACGPSMVLMVATVLFENVAVGLGTTAFTGFLMMLCRRKFTGTQYALVSSCAALSRVFGGMPSGYLQHTVGWAWFFGACALIAVPGIAVAAARFPVWQRDGTLAAADTGRQGAG